MPGWFVHFSAKLKNKQAMVSFQKNCILDAYTNCWKNVDLMLSILMSWRPSERKKVPHNAA